MVLTIVRANTGSFKTFLITQSEYFEKNGVQVFEALLYYDKYTCTCFFVCFAVYCFCCCLKECSIVAKDEFGDQILASGCTLKHVSL